MSKSDENNPKSNWIAFNNFIINPNNIVHIHSQGDVLRIDFSSGRFLDIQGNAKDILWNHFLEFCETRFETAESVNFESTSR